MGWEISTNMAVRPELWAWIVERDAHFVWGQSEDRMHHHVSYFKFRASHKVICVVPTIDPSNPDACAGKQEIDHVKDEPRMGKRAPDDELHLVAMCQNHNTWHPPRRELRQAERAYLKRYAEPEPDRTAL